MAVARPYDFKIDFVRNPICGSAAWVLVIVLKFIFTPIFEIKIQEKDSLTPKKWHTVSVGVKKILKFLFLDIYKA